MYLKEGDFMDNKKTNKYYYKSLMSDTSMSFKVAHEIKEECDYISNKLGVTSSNFIKDCIIDKIVEFHQKDNK